MPCTDIVPRQSEEGDVREQPRAAAAPGAAPAPAPNHDARLVGGSGASAGVTMKEEVEDEEEEEVVETPEGQQRDLRALAPGPE